MTPAGTAARSALLRRGFALEYVTLTWNVVGIVILAIAAISARSVALAGFGLDSLIEIGASTVVIWELSGTGEERQRLGLRLIGFAFTALAVYLLVQSTVVLATGHHPHRSVTGIIWTAMTAAVMFALAAGKARTGRALGNPVLQTKGFSVVGCTCKEGQPVEGITQSLASRHERLLSPHTLSESVGVRSR